MHIKYENIGLYELKQDDYIFLDGPRTEPNTKFDMNIENVLLLISFN